MASPMNNRLAPITVTASLRKAEAVTGTGVMIAQKPRMSSKKITKIRVEINEIETRKQYKKSMN